MSLDLLSVDSIVISKLCTLYYINKKKNEEEKSRWEKKKKKKNVSVDIIYLN